MAVFEYDYQTECNPIPPSEQGLRTIVAEPFLHVTDEIPRHLEGICFDKTGENMYFCSTDIGRVFRYNFASKECKELWTDENVRSFGMKVHRDGRLFVSCFGRIKDPAIYVLTPDGTVEQTLMDGIPTDDLAFDRDGGFYCSQFTGDVFDRTGVIYHVSPDFKEVTVYAKSLAAPNGIALSTDEKILWITEYNGGQLLRTPVNGGWSSMCYAFTGAHGPDSCEIDADDNLYVAMTFQGRILVFNKDGFPIGQVLMPYRDTGHNLISTHATVRPGTRELYITCSDDTYGGSWIFKSESFATAHPGAFQFT